MSSFTQRRASVRPSRANSTSRKQRLQLPPHTALFATAASLLACAVLLAPSFTTQSVHASAKARARQAQPSPDAKERDAPVGATRDDSNRAAIKSAYGRLPLSFVANEGQLDPATVFSARGVGYQLFLTQTGAVLALDRSDEGEKSAATRDARRKPSDDTTARARSVATLKMKLAGARLAESVRGEGQLEGKVNYLVGDDPSKWRTNVATYSAVRYESVYPGVDLIYYGDQRQLEYDFRLAPRADARQIKIKFDGARIVRIDAAGQLVLRAGTGLITQRQPVAYQIVGGARHEIAARYFINARGQVGFRLGAYDHSQPLVIDPVLSYATYLGGSAIDQANGVTIDSAGNAYVVGETTSTNFPTAAAMKSTRTGAGIRDAFVTKLNPSGTALVYSTYLGGSASDRARAVAVDASGNAYVTGWTYSDDFPHTAGAYQQARAGGGDAFVAKLNADGNALVYSTFLGGNNDETGYGIGLDAAGAAYVAGATTSTVFGGTTMPKAGSPAYRSTDAGGSWSPDKTGITDSYISSITVDPVEHNTLYASGSVVWKSTDGGSTWSATPPLPPQAGFAYYPYSVTVDPVVHTTLYAASPGGLYKSTDAGGSWADFSAGLQALGLGCGTSQLLIDPSNHNTLYATNDCGGVYKSTDAGATWKSAYKGMAEVTLVSSLAIDPVNTNTLYAATAEYGVFKSTDGGANWNRSNNGLHSDDYFDLQAGTSVDALVIDPATPSTIYAYTTYYGIYKSTNGGGNWSASNNGLPVTTDWAHHIAIDPLSPSTLYASSSFGVYKTTDGGAHWSSANNGLANRFVNDVTVDPVAPARVFVAIDSGNDAFVAKLDPAGASLGYLRYLGGNEDDIANAVAVDAAGDAHVVGTTYSSNFPVGNALRAASGGLSDAFVAKLTPSGSITYSTYLGGDGYDTGQGVALDGAGRVYVTGSAASSNFPVTVVRKQPDPDFNEFYSDVFLTRLVPDGSAFDYSFIYGSSDYDAGIAVAADAAGNAYVVGIPGASDFPLFNAAPDAQGGAFLLKFDAAGNIAYSTLFGSCCNSIPLAVAADNNGAVYVAGKTDSLSFPVTAGAFQRTRGGGTDGFVAKFLTGTEAAPLVQFDQPTLQVSEDAGHATLTVMRTGDASSPLTVSYQTLDDPAAISCSDTTNNHGAAYARCDYATTVGTLTFAANDTTPKQITIPLINDAYVESNETFQVRLSSPTNATLGTPSTVAVTITSEDQPGTPNPITNPNPDFFVRQQYLDFLSREPETAQPWSAVLNGCPNQFNTDPNSPSASCDRIAVSANFFRSQEFQLKGLYVFHFYKVAFGRLPTYAEMVADMSSVTGATTAEVQQKKAVFTSSFARRQEFKNTYDALTNWQFVDALMNRYNLQQITTPDPASPDGTAKVTLTRTDLANRLNSTGGTLTRDQALRAIADSDEVSRAEFNPAFVAMQYFGYLRRDPEASGYQAWLDTINANPSDFRAMVNGFMNSTEYRLRFGQP